MKRLHLFALILGLAVIAPCLRAAVSPAEARGELERIEDLRFLHRFAIQDLHDCRALAMYRLAWGGEDRSTDVEGMFIEAESLYGVLRGVDNGATALQAQLDAGGKDLPSAAQLDLLKRARGQVAQRVNDFYQRSAALKKELTQQVNEAAKKKAKWDVVSQPEPWADSVKDAGRKDGLRYGWIIDDRFMKWPEADGNYLLGKAKKMGVSFVNITWPAASNWGDIEREPGKYDFASLDAAVARFAGFDMRAALLLNTLTGTPPKWWIEKNGPDCQFTLTVKDPKDPKVDKKIQSGINLMHAATGEAFGKFLTAYAAHLKEKWAGVVEGVYVEGGQREIEAVPDESKPMDDYWRKWSKTDAPWRTPESLLAEPKVDEAAVARAEMCRETWLIDYLKAVRAGLKQGSADLPVQIWAIGDDFHRLFASTTGKSRNPYELCQLADNPGSDTDSPASFAMLRHGAGDHWLWQLGIHSGCGTTAGAAFVQPLFFGATRISGGFPGFSLRAHFPGSWFRYADFQAGEAGIGSFYLSPRKAEEIAPIVLNTTPEPPQVAVLWSQTSMRRDRTHELFQSAMAWGHLLKRARVEFTYVTEEEFPAALKDYKVLILPNTQSMTLGTCDAIRRWVQGGGVVMGFGAPGLFDEIGTRRASLPLADVFGADLAAMRVPTPIDPDKLWTTRAEGSYQFTDMPPRAYLYHSNLTASLKPTQGKARAWFASAEKDVAIVENTFGSGKAMLCGYPLGKEYWESCVYEIAYGLTQARHLNYNEDQKRYERWIAAELEKVGVTRPVTMPSGRFLREQRSDDGDWYHIFRNTPAYRELMYELDQPVRTVYSFLRRREGISNLYLGLLDTEANFQWERAYFVSTLAGGEVTTSVSVGAATAPIAFDVRLGVPVPATLKDGQLSFTTWLPTAQAAAFAIAPDGKVRLFGEAHPHGDSPETIAQRTKAYADGAGLSEVELLDGDRVAQFLEARRGKTIRIGCADPRFQPVAQELASWLKESRGITAEILSAGPRATLRFDFMDSFGWTQYGIEPIVADILVGNCQDNSLMWRFLRCHNDCYWLPLEINQDFPGLGHAVVMLSTPVMTHADGEPGGKPTDSQLVIGASYPSEAMRAVGFLKTQKGMEK